MKNTNYDKALKIATDAHKGQKRWNGDDYITHPIRVADNLVDDTMKAIAVLHDTVEDTDVTYEQLLCEFDDIIALNVMILTRNKKTSYADYIQAIKLFSERATRIKIYDLKDNLRDLKKGQRRDKYELALKLLLGD